MLPIKIQIETPKPLPKVDQYPVGKETLHGIKPVTEFFID